jgi:exodeoxyribonuclease-3
MKLATWNVNSLNVRLPHVLDWLTASQPDVLCLQETKLEDSKFPYDALREAGYEAVHNGQKTYNGVAILSHHPLNEPVKGMTGFEDEQKRIISASVGELRVVCAYFPNGQAVGSEKYQYKLRWLEAFTKWLGEELIRYPKLVLLGDYNIAPEDRDVHDPAAWEGQVHVSEPEREAFRKLVSLGLYDAFRMFEQAEKAYSWWDYRMGAFRRNMGLRIDHILVSEPLKKGCMACTIDVAPRKLERPSDHTVVMLELNQT